jgi:hypothetical protein
VTGVIWDMSEWDHATSGMSRTPSFSSSPPPRSIHEGQIGSAVCRLQANSSFLVVLCQSNSEMSRLTAELGVPDTVITLGWIGDCEYVSADENVRFEYLGRLTDWSLNDSTLYQTGNFNLSSRLVSGQ